MNPAPQSAPRSVSAFKPQSLRVRTILVVGGVMLVFWAVSLSGIFFFLLGSFGRLQQYLTSERMKQVVLQVDEIASEKLRLVKDNAVWDDAYHFLQGSNPDYMAGNYAPRVDTTGQDVVMVFDANKRLVAAAAPHDEKNPSSPPAGLDLAALAGSSLFSDKAVAGLVGAKDGVLMLAAYPVVHSDGSGPSLGWLVFGQFLDARTLAKISHLASATNCSEVTSVNGPIGVDREAHGVITTGRLGEVLTIMPNCGGGDLLCRSSLVFPSLENGKDIVFSVEVKERVFRTAFVIWQKLIWCAIAGGVALVLIALGVVEVLVLRPLTRLQNDLTAIMGSHRGSVRIPAKGAVEFKRMAQSINQLLDSERIAIQTLDEQKTLLSSVLDTAFEAVIAFQPMLNADHEVVDLRIVVFNRSAEKAVGRKADDVIGRTFGEQFPGARVTGLLNRMIRVIHTQEPDRFDYQSSLYLNKRWFQVSATPWGNGVLMTFEDISERKAKEKQLHETMEDVERFNRAMIGREERVVELKKEVNVLHARLGLPGPYEEHCDEE